MDNELYTRTLAENREDGTRDRIVLTKEVNRLILWQILSEGEESTYQVVETWELFQKNEAIERAVHFAQTVERNNDRQLVQSIVRQVSAREWNGDALIRVVDELRQAGYTVLDLEAS